MNIDVKKIQEALLAIVLNDSEPSHNRIAAAQLLFEWSHSLKAA